MLHRKVNLKFDAAVLICFLVETLKIEGMVITKGSLGGGGGGGGQCECPLPGGRDRNLT